MRHVRRGRRTNGGDGHKQGDVEQAQREKQDLHFCQPRWKQLSRGVMIPARMRARRQSPKRRGANLGTVTAYNSSHCKRACSFACVFTSWIFPVSVILKCSPPTPRTLALITAPSMFLRETEADTGGSGVRR